MSPDAALVVFTALGFASVFLALVIGLSGGDIGETISGIAAMTPSARKQARAEQLDYMTQMADEAIEARRLGRRVKSPQHGF